MTPTRRAALQSQIIDAVKASDRTLTDAALAAIMGCDRSNVSRYRSGEREMGLGEIAALLAGGADPVLVLGPLAEIAGAEVVVKSEEAPAAVALSRCATKLTLAAAQFGEAVETSLEDGRLTDDEAADLVRRHHQLTAEVSRVGRRIRPGVAS